MNQVDPMIPFLAGWLAGSLLRDGRECMKIETVDPEAPNKVTVRFASGLTLLVTVTEATPEAPADRPGADR